MHRRQCATCPARERGGSWDDGSDMVAVDGTISEFGFGLEMWVKKPTTRIVG